MSSLSIGHDWPVPRNQIEILVVESDPADTRLTEEALVDPLARRKQHQADAHEKTHRE